MKSFDDLDRKELYRAALEDFAVEVAEDANKATIKAAFLETGITWADYVAQHPELAPAVEEKVVLAPVAVVRETEPARAGGVITSDDLKGDAVIVEAPVLRVQEPLHVNPTDIFLIKMIRPNTLYETRGYKFTQEHPYAVVNADDAEYILEHEDGFRQALPTEASAYYR